MKNFIRAAQAQVATQLFDGSTNCPMNLHKLNRLLFSTMLAVGLAAGGPITEAKAADNQTYSKVIGAGVGAFAGAKLSRNKTYAERAAIITIAGAAGTWVADSLSSNNQRRPQQYQDQRRSQVVQSWSGQSNAYTQNRVYNQSRTNRQNQYSQEAQGPELVSPTQFDMPPVFVEALKLSGNLGMVRGSGNIVMSDDAFQRMNEVTRSLSRAGQVYAEGQESWDSAQLIGGSEGVNAKKRSADMLNSSMRMIQARAQDWIDVRNALAIKGVDVEAFDNAVRSDLSRITIASSYNYRMNSNYNPRH